MFGVHYFTTIQHVGSNILIQQQQNLQAMLSLILYLLQELGQDLEGKLYPSANLMVLFPLL